MKQPSKGKGRKEGGRKESGILTGKTTTINIACCSSLTPSLPLTLCLHIVRSINKVRNGSLHLFHFLRCFTFVPKVFQNETSAIRHVCSSSYLSGIFFFFLCLYFILLTFQVSVMFFQVSSLVCFSLLFLSLSLSLSLSLFSLFSSFHKWFCQFGSSFLFHLCSVCFIFIVFKKCKLSTSFQAFSFIFFFYFASSLSLRFFFFEFYFSFRAPFKLLNFRLEFFYKEEQEEKLKDDFGV